MQLQDWIKEFAPKDAFIKGCDGKCYTFKDSIVADIFADLSFGS